MTIPVSFLLGLVVLLIHEELGGTLPGIGSLTRLAPWLVLLPVPWLLARYTAYKRDQVGKTFRVAPFVGIEIPSGKDDEGDELGQLPQPLQLGSGSWDPSIGTIVTWQTLGWQIDTSASYKFNTGANGFEFGDVARVDFSYQRRLRPRELGEGVPNFLYGVLESNLIW